MNWKELNEPQFTNGRTQSPLLFRFQTTIDADFDNRYIGEGVAEHVDERHVHSVIEPGGVVATSISTTFLSDWRDTRRNTVLSEAR